MSLWEKADAYHNVLRAEHMAEGTRLMFISRLQCISVFNVNWCAPRALIIQKEEKEKERESQRSLRAVLCLSVEIQTGLLEIRANRVNIQSSPRGSSDQTSSFRLLNIFHTCLRDALSTQTSRINLKLQENPPWEGVYFSGDTHQIFGFRSFCGMEMQQCML